MALRSVHGEVKEADMRLFSAGIRLVGCVAILALLVNVAQASQPVPPDPVLGLHTTNATGEKRLIVIFADFPDVTRQYSTQAISDRILKSVNQYFYAASYGAMWFRGEVVGPYVLPHPVSDYRISSRNLEVDPTRVLSLIRDAVDAADADVTFSEDAYVVLALGATHVEYGMVGLCGFPGMLGWSSTAVLTTRSGERVQNAAIFCENAHLGTYVHDITHMLGGAVNGQRLTPCLYDHDIQAQFQQAEDWPACLVNMGYWDPLSSHFPYNRELPPAGLSSWTKLRLGWIDPAKVALVAPGETATVRLDPLADPTSTTLVIKIPLSAETYYLVENRQSINSDVNLPSTGVLVLYADDTVGECRHGAAPVKAVDANPQVPYLMDAAFDLGKARVFVDAARNLGIVLLAKADQSYDILVTTAIVAASYLP
jgi:M6 family metalloprotease-like protein